MNGLVTQSSTQNLFFKSEKKREFSDVLNEVQSYISSKYSALVIDGINNVNTGNDEVKNQVKRYIGKYLLDYRISVENMTQTELIDALYTEMAEFSFLTKYIFGTGIEEININSWDDIEVQYSNGTSVKIDEKFESPDHAINVVRRTPQGGILSPLLANIVLNELDWWISSQWENMPTRHQYKTGIKANGSENHGNKYTALKKSSLKEMYIVRYADDFKIFCRNRSNADKIFYAVKHWLKDRLSLEISDEKSKVVNLKKHYSEFLGFKIKAVKKGGRYVVRSHMSDKAVKCETEKLKKQIIAIEHSGNTEEIYEQARRYNQIVVGIHNYYRYATHISEDCNKIQFIVSILMYNRLRQGLSKKGNINLKFVAEKYGDSKSMRYYCQYPIVPIGYVQTRNPMYKKRTICKYTAEGREEIHRQLKFDEITMTVLHMMSIQHISNRSIEYMDNRISVFASQHGKCAITGKPLWIDELECHHKIPLNQGGNDKYDNLVILCSDVHKLIHAVNPDIIQFYLNKIKPNKSQLRKINSLRLMAKNSVI